MYVTMYYSGSNFNPCHGLCPLYGGCSPLGGSVMGGSTVVELFAMHLLCCFSSMIHVHSQFCVHRDGCDL